MVRMIRKPLTGQELSSEVETEPIPSLAPAWARSAELAATEAMLEIDIPAGTQLGSYVLGERIGEGGCGAVYRATHIAMGRPGAIKVLHRDMAQSPEMVERFLREMRAANLIRHPNIVDIWDSGEAARRPYFVMELLEGLSLRELLRRGTLSPAEALELLEPVCAAVEAAHEVGIIHRDLKASNIMVCDDASGRRVKLLDFGIAKLTQSDGESTALTAVGRKLGTPTSMSPEQILGLGVDRRTDIYALGVLLFQMMTCRYPFEAAEPSEIERGHLEQAPPRPSEYVAVGAAVDAVVLCCLEKQPQQRYASATAFVVALRQAVEDSRGRPVPEVGDQPRRALAILTEVALSEHVEETMDEPMVEDLMNVLECAQQMLVEAGLHVPLQTGSAVLGVMALSTVPADHLAERARLVAHAIQLFQALDQRPGRQPGVSARVRIYLEDAVLRPTGSGGDEVTGPILGIAQLAPEQTGSGLYASTEMMAGIEMRTERLSEAQLKIVLDGAAQASRIPAIGP